MRAMLLDCALGGADLLEDGLAGFEQWRFLAERGCRLGQGFHFSRPVTPREILARDLRERSHPAGPGGQVMRSM